MLNKYLIFRLKFNHTYLKKEIMKQLFFLMIVFILVGCASSKEMPTAEKLSALKSAVENKKIKFEGTSANAIGLASVRGINNLMPSGSNPSNISLIGNSNYFIINKDTIQMDMPYFGRQDIPNSYNGGDEGFEFDGKYTQYSQNFDKKKGHYTLKITIILKKETVNVNYILYANNKASLDIISTIRTTISYSGDWEAIE
jgi:hypothetical protein